MESRGRRAARPCRGRQRTETDHNVPWSWRTREWARTEPTTGLRVSTPLVLTPGQRLLEPPNI